MLPPRTNRTRVARGPSSLSSTNFSDLLRRRGNRELHALNRSMHSAIERRYASASTKEDDRLDDDLFTLSDEYVRQETLFNQRFVNEGSLYAMGSDENKQIGIFSEDDDVTDRSRIAPIPIQIGLTFRQIRAGGLHSVALPSDRGVPYTWGINDNQALGRVTQNDTEERRPIAVTGFVRHDTGIHEDEQIVEVAAGENHCLFLSSSGAVYQCGGYRDIDKKYFCDMEGLNGEVLGTNVKPVHVHQMPGPVIAVFARETVNAALLSDNSLVTWGFGNSGELARSAGMTKPDDNGKYDVGKMFAYEKEFKAEGVWEITDKPKLDIIKEHFLKPKPVLWQSNPTLKRTVISVGIGSVHLVVVARDPGTLMGKVYTSGLNSFGQLGQGDDSKDTSSHALTLVKALEHENMGQVAAGSEFTLALSLDRRALYSFGRADYGQLGIGVIFEELSFRSSPQRVQFPDAVKVLEIGCGEKHAMVRTEENELYTWGFNEDGATGHVKINTDIFLPRKLDLMQHVDDNDISHCDVVGISGGSQHSLLLAKFFRKLPTE